jgi:uncharacterized NAD(P)/FAD-binding protein YdhS
VFKAFTIDQGEAVFVRQHVDVAIVGAGLAGTLTAVHLLRQPAPLRVVLIERSGRFGPGVAYGTQDEHHLLNVPAERMSAFADEPDHFRAWAARRLPDLAPGAFLPRRLYGTYLGELLEEAAAQAPPNALERVVGEAVDVRRTRDALELRLADGRRIACERCVVATGSPPAPTPIPLPDDDPRVVRDPWAAPLAPAPAAEPTLAIGTGMTAVDVVLSHHHAPATPRRDAVPVAGPVLAVSRRGRLPRAHLPGLRAPAPAPALPAQPASLASVERLVLDHVGAMRAHGYDWRDAVDSLRPVTPALWQLLPTAERRRFVRERARSWEVRRHRLAPSVADRLARLRAARGLRVAAARIVGVRAAREALTVELASADGAVRQIRCARVVVCTGTIGDVTRTPDRLLRALLQRGQAVPDALRLGLRTTADGALLDASGHADGRLLTLGPLRRGELWESTAAGEIRLQAQALAAHLHATAAAPSYTDACARLGIRSVATDVRR